MISAQTQDKSTTQSRETAKSSSDIFSAMVDSIVERTGKAKMHAWKETAEENPELYASVQSELDQKRAERDEQERDEREAEAKQRINENWVSAAGRFAGCRIEDFRQHGTPDEQAAQKRVIDSLTSRDLREIIERGQNLLFVGPPGSGKDHLMHSLAWRVLHKLKGRIVTRNGSALRQQLKRAAMESAEAEARLLRSLTDTRLLLLSDPVPTGGKELSDFQADSLYHVIDSRWTAKRPTWATLNLPLETMRDSAIASITAPVWDRLKDNSLMVICNWESYRTPAEIIK